MSSLISKCKQTLYNLCVDKVLFRRDLREKFCRHEFFYDAFRALYFNGIDGDYAEFGCHSGKTFSFAYRESRRHKLDLKLWAFDSFGGLPGAADPKDEHLRWRAGSRITGLEEFHAICHENGVPRNSYETVVGFYEDSLPKLKGDQQPRNICLAYVDCDLYSSTKAVLEFLKPRLKHGMILAFDDYFTWSSSKMSGNRQAMLEAFEKGLS